MFAPKAVLWELVDLTMLVKFLSDDPCCHGESLFLTQKWLLLGFCEF